MKMPLAASLVMIAASGSLFFGSCKKKDDSPSKSALLKASPWKYKEAGIDLDNNGSGETPIPPGTLQSYDLDNTVTFQTDTTGIVDEGPTKFPASNPQTSTFKYTFNSSTNVINFSTAVFAGISGDAKVLELSATQLKISKAVPITGVPAPLTVVVTLVH